MNVLSLFITQTFFILCNTFEKCLGVGTSVVLNPVDIHCMDKRNINFLRTVLFYVPQKKVSPAGL